jgi:AraC-like DNA-binding protein
MPLPPEFDHLMAEATFRCDSVAHAPVPNPWVPVAHSSLFDKVYAVTKGGGWCSLDRNYWNLKPGMVLLFSAGTIQQGLIDPRPEKQLIKYWIHFESTATKGVPVLRLIPPPPCLVGASAKKMLQLTQKIHEERRAKAVGYSLATQHLLTELVLTAYRAPEKDRRKPDKVLPESEHAPRVPLEVQFGRLRKAIAVMTQRYAHPLSLEDLASAAGLHPVYFNQVFRKTFGVPPMRYLEQQRLRRAKELIAGTDRTMTEIAFEVGYSDPYYFSRAFRRLTGMPPSVYREEALKSRAK